MRKRGDESKRGMRQEESIKLMNKRGKLIKLAGPCEKDGSVKRVCEIRGINGQEK